MSRHVISCGSKKTLKSVLCHVCSRNITLIWSGVASRALARGKKRASIVQTLSDSELVEVNAGNPG